MAGWVLTQRKQGRSLEGWTAGGGLDGWRAEAGGLEGWKGGGLAG